MKKILTCILLSGMVFMFDFTSVFALENPFSDTVSSNEDAILYLTDQGIINGYPDGTIRVLHNINRAELTKILVEGNGITPDSLIYNNCFNDVIDDWYAPYVCYAKEQGWVQGYADGNFKPAQTIIRAEVLKLILESQDYAIPRDVGFIPYEDVATSQWYAPYVRVGYEHNLIPELGTKFNPADDMTRGSAFEILFRTLIIDELGLSVYDKAATNAVFGRDRVQDVRLHGNDNNISVRWETFGGYAFEDYGILMKEGSDFTEEDIADEIEPIYLNSTETKSITLANENCETELSLIDPAADTEFDFEDEISFTWDGPGCSDYEFKQYMICFVNADPLIAKENVCFGSTTNSFQLSADNWDLMNGEFTVDENSNILNLDWFVYSRFENHPLMQDVSSESRKITLNI